MTKEKATELYHGGGVPVVSDLDGDWQVGMWRWWRFMRHDIKVIRDGAGYNLYRVLGCIPVKWGKFTVVQQSDCLELIYKNGTVIDRLRTHASRDGFMLGLFNTVIDGKPVVSKEPFTLTLLNEKV